MLPNDWMNDLQKIGEAITIKGNQTIDWDDSQYVWFVVRGEVNLFAVPYDGENIVGNREFLFSVSEGKLIIGNNNAKNLPLRLLISGMTETEVIQMKSDSFMRLCVKEQHFQELINEWNENLQGWIEQQEVINIVKADESSPDHFFNAVHALMEKSVELEVERLHRLEKIDQDKLHKSMKSLVDTMRNKEQTFEFATTAADDVLVRTCKLIGEKSGIAIKTPIHKQTDHLDTAVRQIAKASNVRKRKVTLQADWWKSDHGALLCFMKENLYPVALVQTSFNRYELHDLGNGTVKQMRKELEEQLIPQAYMFYRPLPNKSLNLLDLVKFSVQTKNVKKDIAVLFTLGILGGLLGLAVPIGLGQLVDTIIPAADRTKIIDFVLILVAISITMFTFELTRSLAMLRVEGRLDAHMQAAVWDRVLNLPVPFFRQFTAGDLALRANSISAIRQTLSGTTLATIFSGIFSFTQLFLLFLYSPKLAWIATILIIVVIAITLIFGIIMVQNERQLANLNGKLTGLVFQMINGIAKFRVSGSEKRAFSLWSDHFSAVRKVSFKTGMIENNFQIFNTTYPVFATIVLFYSVLAFVPTMTPGSFLTFHAAFASFIGSMMGMTFSLISALTIIPLYERAKPILKAEPEINEEKEEITELFGEIEVNQVDFRYDEEGPLILENISLRVHPGEFVAIVGTSGSGKSTLMRLLLGFEQPTSGSVYYDQHELRGLDVQSVRSKLGVVLQSGQLLSGDIYTNIIGSSNLTIDDAWEAARMAGLEADIKKMPMGMFTVVDEGARTLSGGQRQRLLIARALVHRPSVIFFDEATSALDNHTQKIVSDSIESLQATRIVIAHRLSTIMNADRIYVMDAGEIVEEGTFEELMEQKGMFSDLARRQMA